VQHSLSSHPGLCRAHVLLDCCHLAHWDHRVCRAVWVFVGGHHWPVPCCRRCHCSPGEPDRDISRHDHGPTRAILPDKLAHDGRHCDEVRRTVYGGNHDQCRFHRGGRWYDSLCQGEAFGLETDCL
ncbi:hypothetical protein FQN49_008825, partial [Arthroderma sp. PD_2]